MSFFDTVSEGASEFLDAIWVDVLVLVFSLVVCVVGAIVFPKPDLQAQKVGISDGPVVRLHNAARMALGACGIIQKPRSRSKWERLGVQSGGVSETNPGSYESFMIALRDVLNNDGVDSSFGLLKEMQSWDYHIPASAVTRMLKDHSPKDACALLRRMQDAGVKPDVVAYNCVIASCVNGNDLQRARTVVKEMRQVAGEPDVITYCTLLKGCHAVGDLHGAKQVLILMAAAGHRPKEISYNTLINAAVSNGEFQIAWDTIDEMKKNGVPVDGYTVSIMMKALRQRNSRRPLHSKHAARVFEFLDETDVDFCSDEVLLTTVLDTCMWHKEFARLQRIFENYLQSELKPSVVVYGSLIKAAKTLKRMDWVWKLWKELVDERKMVPNHIVLGCMLDALVCNSSVDEAVTIFEDWKARVPPTTVIYSTLAKGFLNTNQASKAMQILAEMQSNGIPRSTVLYNMVIGVHAAHGSMDDVAELMKCMQADDCTPDIITYSTVVKGHCVKGDLDSAFLALRQAQESGIVLDAIVYSSIFYGCYRHNRPDLTDELVSGMSSLGLTPSSFTLSIIVKMYGSQGRLNRAFEVVEALGRQDLSTDARVATSLLKECVKTSDIDRAADIFHLLLPTGGPDAKSFWPLISCCVRRGEFLRAHNFVQAWHASCRTKGDLNDALTEQLLCTLEGGRPNQESEALAILEQMRPSEPDAGCKAA
jgi:pentatricopeptide repeat protein